MTTILHAFVLPAAHAALLHNALPRGTFTGVRTAVMMNEVPPQWRGPAIKQNVTMAPDVTQAAEAVKELLQEEAAAPAASFEEIQEQVPRLDDLLATPRLEDMVAKAAETPDTVKEQAEKYAFFVESWAEEKSRMVKEMDFEDMKATLTTKMPEVQAEVQTKAKALYEDIKQTEVGRKAADKISEAAQTLEDSNAVKNLKESYAKLQKSEAFKATVEACAEAAQTLQAKAEEHELVPKAKAFLEAALEKARKAIADIVAALKEK
jgi:HD-GYP domain-containing protein (c-di-GMP phosphodiesterase class II)